ncbi:uncharacterized protein [Nicotiana tomentosiformis]|uniref:uncharacterized protein n=1 Tax=Nicotiana tomentosiformis TaxID=4098 RepID=UPI00388C7D5C
MKVKALEDHLAENPIDDDYKPLSTYFLDEEVNSIEEVVSDDIRIWKMYFDGAVNIKGVGIRAILISPIGQHYPTMARLHFFYTNNTTEYEACIMGLKMALDLYVHELLVIGDSDLLIRQAQGEWETQDINFIPYRKCVQDLSKRFKSIEFSYFKAVTKKTVVDFVHSNIICRFGIPKTIFTDNATNLNSHMMKEAEVEIPSLRIIVESEIEDTEWVKTRLEQLMMIDEKRLAAVCFGQLYQQRIVRAYNKKVHLRHFEVVQLILKHILPHQVEAKGKFAPNWQGPYIKNVLPKGALHLVDEEGLVPDMTINADAVKRYYV